MNHVPPEIFSQIFKGDPLLASHVCHRWRAISTGDPRLWDSPVFDIEAIASTHSVRLNLMELWLLRSADQPLHITLKMDPTIQPQLETFDAAVLAFALIARHTPRWETLTLTLPASDEVFSAFFREISRAIPLTRLSVANVLIGNFEEIHKDHRACNLPTYAPALRELRWSNRRVWHFLDIPAVCGLPTIFKSRGLVRLTLDTFTTPKCALSLIADAPSLSILELMRLGFIPPEENVHLRFTPDAPLCSTVLRTLTVHQKVLNEALPALLPCMRCPALLHLSITSSVMSEQYGPVGGAIGGFLLHSGRNLQELTFDGIGIRSAHLVAALARTPDLRRLVLRVGRSGPSVDDSLLMALTPCEPGTRRGVGGVALCPRLRALLLHHIVESTDGVLSAMLHSRSGGGAMHSEGDGEVNISNDVAVAHLAEVDIVLPPWVREENIRDMEYLSTLKNRGG